MMKKNNSGFTLLELLGVMGVIVVMSFVVVSSFRNIRQGLNDTSSSKTLHDSILLARQHAMLDNSRVFLIVTGINSYLLCREGGVVTHKTTDGTKYVEYLDRNVSAFWMSDEWTDWDALSEGFIKIYDKDKVNNMIGANAHNFKYKGISVYDLNEGEYATIAVPPFQDNNDLWCIGFNKSTIKNSNLFNVGNTYGWMLYEERFLPRGYAFDNKHYKLDEKGFFESCSGSILCFNQDGTIDVDTNSNFVDELIIGEVDATKAESIKNTVSIQIDMNGSIVIK